MTFGVHRRMFGVPSLAAKKAAKHPSMDPRVTCPWPRMNQSTCCAERGRHPEAFLPTLYVRQDNCLSTSACVCVVVVVVGGGEGEQTRTRHLRNDQYSHLWRKQLEHMLQNDCVGVEPVQLQPTCSSIRMRKIHSAIHLEQPQPVRV